MNKIISFICILVLTIPLLITSCDRGGGEILEPVAIPYTFSFPNDMIGTWTNGAGTLVIDGDTAYTTLTNDIVIVSTHAKTITNRNWVLLLEIQSNWDGLSAFTNVPINTNKNHIRAEFYVTNALTLDILIYSNTVLTNSIEGAEGLPIISADAYAKQ